MVALKWQLGKSPWQCAQLSLILAQLIAIILYNERQIYCIMYMKDTAAVKETLHEAIINTRN